MRARHLIIPALGLAACAASVGLVLAQDIDRAPPPPPGYVPGGGYAPPGADGGAGPAGAPVVPLAPAAVPPEEAAPPPPSTPAEQADAEDTEPPPPPTDSHKLEPAKRTRYVSAILQAVDKVTAETLRFEAKVGEPVRYKGLVLTVHACEGTASDEGYVDSIAHLDVQSQPEALAAPAPVRVVFRGWMFASSPGLHPLEHPLYDVWLIACRTAAPGVAGASL